MKKILSLVAILGIALSFTACSTSSSNVEKEEPTVQPNNIDENNVGITSGENPDQTDPTLIEGNLEDNDFKN